MGDLLRKGEPGRLVEDDGLPIDTLSGSMFWDLGTIG